MTLALPEMYSAAFRRCSMLIMLHWLSTYHYKLFSSNHIKGENINISWYKTILIIFPLKCTDSYSCIISSTYKEEKHMSAKLPTKEEELCHLENGLKNKKWFWIPTNHRLVKIKFHKHLLNGVHEAEPDTWIFHLFYN